MFVILYQAFDVSIHAPVKERHITEYPDLGGEKVSIHAPVKERHIEADLQAENLGFNPRSREGATIPTGLFSISSFVSIHAPVKERLIIQTISRQRKSFNPRSREGATPVWRPRVM